MIKNISFIGIIVLVVFIFFSPFFLQGKLPIPSDTVVGLYHPFRDLYASEYPNGIPYKNPLITDPVRQQYPWRFLAIEQIKKGEVPLWNPYNLSGSPLAATLQAGAFYPLNFLFFFLPFSLGWSFLIVLQPLLAGLFLYWYLRNLNIHSLASLLGAITFAFSGFSIAWLEWGTIGHVALWLPLLLLCIDKVFGKKHFLWMVLFVFALASSFFAGHVQTFFYVSVLATGYFLLRWFQFGRSKKIFFSFILLTICFLLLTFIQWYPMLQLIMQSAREIDLVPWNQQEGWFIPVSHLIQFVAPDFFGNPTTLNYWGTWNYGEMVGYVGIVSLLSALFAILARRDKETYFFATFLFLALLFALPTFIAELPFIVNIPFLATSQPTRLLFIVDFALSVLAALGFDLFIRSEHKKRMVFPVVLLGLLFASLWFFVLQNDGENMLVAKRNLYLPTLILVVASVIILLTKLIKQRQIQIVLIVILLGLTFFDLLRFAQKFTPFTDSAYLFPQTKMTSFLQKDKDLFRIMETDPRIMTPNFSLMYHIQSVDGYDPLYLRRYGELVAANERRGPDIHVPFGFNRTVTPESTASATITNLLGVKYVLTFTHLEEPRFTKVFEEGKTQVYKNNAAYPRAFFVKDVRNVSGKEKAIEAFFDPMIDLRDTAIVEGFDFDKTILYAVGKVRVLSYEPNTIRLQTENKGTGFLVLTDVYYPTWRAKVCPGNETSCKETQVYLTDYIFRGILVPSGKYTIVFENRLF